MIVEVALKKHFVLFCFVLFCFVFCKKDYISEEASLTIEDYDKEVSLTIKDYDTYISECEKFLGKIPIFQCNKNSIEINPTNKFVSPPDCDDHSIAAMTIPGSYFVKGCHKSRFGLEKLNSTVWVFECVEGLPPHQETQMEMFAIGYNMKTGHTCFLQSYDNISISQRVSPPRTNQEHSWEKFEDFRVERCTGCHSIGPYVRTSFLTKIFKLKPKDEREQKLIKSLKEIFYTDYKKKPYIVVGLKDLLWPTPKYFVKSDNTCTTCHNIGNDAYCKHLVPISWGKLPFNTPRCTEETLFAGVDRYFSPEQREQLVKENCYYSANTDYKKYHFPRFMPPNHKKSLHEVYEKDVKEIIDSCDDKKMWREY